MTLKLRKLGLVVVAALTLGAVFAPVSQATTATLTAEKYPTTLTGTQVGTGQLSVGNGARIISCTTVTAHGTITGPTTKGTVTPKYAGCSSTGGLPATVTLNGCDYEGESTKVTATTGTGTVSVVCPAGKEIIVDIYASAAKHLENVRACEYGVPPQVNVPAGEYHLEGAGVNRDITGTANNKTVIKSYIGSKILCGLSAGETGTGLLTGTGTMKGEDASGNPVGIFVS